MDVAIAGSTGLLGTALARSLRSDGHRVIRLVRTEPPMPSDLAIRWDPTSETIDANRLEGLDAAVCLSGAGIGDRRWTEQRKRVLVDSRVGSTGLLARTLARLDRPPPVLLSASAVGYYGNRGDDVLTEESGRGTGFLADLCRAWEDATAPAADAGIRVVRLRSGIVLTPQGQPLSRQLPLFRLGLGGRLGSGTQYTSWISIDDEIGAMRWLLDRDIEGPVNLTAPEPVPNATLTRALGRVLGRPTVLPVPRPALRALFGSEFTDEAALASQRALPEVLRRSGFEFRHPGIEEAFRALLERSATTS